LASLGLGLQMRDPDGAIDVPSCRFAPSQPRRIFSAGGPMEALRLMRPIEEAKFCRVRVPRTPGALIAARIMFRARFMLCRLASSRMATVACRLRGRRQPRQVGDPMGHIEALGLPRSRTGIHPWSLAATAINGHRQNGVPGNLYPPSQAAQPCSCRARE